MKGARVFKYEGELIGHCKFCRRRIYWARRKNGRPIPVDFEFKKAHFLYCSAPKPAPDRTGPGSGRMRVGRQAYERKVLRMLR